MAESKEEKESLWGYGSGVASAYVAGKGSVVLAETTLTFNQGDITYFVPLSIRTVAVLGFFPTHLTADAAFDAWYTYQMVVHRHGMAAIPSIPMVIPRVGVPLMACRSVRKACACIPPVSSLTRDALSLATFPLSPALS